MSGHTPGDHLDLDAIETWARSAPGERWDAEPNGRGYLDIWTGYGTDEECVAQALSQAAAEHVAGMDPVTTLALVAEVRRLREENDAHRTSVAGLRAALSFKQGIIDDLSATVERLEADDDETTGAVPDFRIRGFGDDGPPIVCA